MRLQIGFGLLLAVLAGCNACESLAPFVGLSATPVPAVGNLAPVATLSSSPHPSAIPSSTPIPTATPPAWPTPAGDEDILPAPLYYVSNHKEENGQQCPLPHVVRLDRDGHTRTVIGSCFILGGIHGFDVSPVDGSVVLAAEGSLWIVDADGQNARRLAEGMPDPEAVSRAMFEIQSPAWSPDGTQVAYADGGIRILDVASGQRQDVAENWCLVEERLGPGYAPCFYGIWLLDPRWSPDGKAILFLKQTADYPITEIFIPAVDDQPRTVPGTLGVAQDDLAWTHDGTSLLFDYWWPANIGPITSTEPSFVRVSRDDFDVQVLWSHGDRADPVFFSNANNPRQARYPFEAPDGRILFFQAEPCSTGSCYDYALVEGRLTADGFRTRVLRHDALPDGLHTVIWHDSGTFIAFLAGSSNGSYVGVMQVNTGEILLLAEEEAERLFPIVWGNP